MLRQLAGAVKALHITENICVEISPLRNGLSSGDHFGAFCLLHEAGFTFIGPFGNDWFSKDPAILRTFFGAEEARA